MKTERLLLVLFSILASVSGDYGGCGGHTEYNCSSFPNEIYSPCANCETTCSVTAIDPECSKTCMPGCACDSRISKHLRNSQGECVPDYECDAPCENDYGKIYDPCAGVCQKTCNDIYTENFECPKSANCTNQGGCKCYPGLVMNDGGHCVIPEDCAIVCPPNESYSECAAGLEYENTCQEPKKKWTCLYPYCKSGCTCNIGFKRDDNGVCIPEWQCNETCGGDPAARKIFCTPCSVTTCTSINDEPIPCDLYDFQCDGVEGCECKSGYALHDGICIKLKDCPTCGGNFESYLCRLCDLNVKNFDPYCTNKQSCQNGCFCNIGFARNETGSCVRLNEICQPPCDGDSNAYFEQCGVHCEERTCQNKDVSLPTCKDSCHLEGKCLCKKGYIKNSAGICVLPENCECDKLQQRSFLPKHMDEPPVEEPVTENGDIELVTDRNDSSDDNNSAFDDDDEYMIPAPSTDHKYFDYANPVPIPPVDYNSIYHANPVSIPPVEYNHFNHFNTAPNPPAEHNYFDYAIPTPPVENEYSQHMNPIPTITVEKPTSDNPCEIPA